MSNGNALEGLPKDLVAHDPAEGSATVTVDASVYPIEALYGAAYIFIDRCYVLIDKAREGAFAVTLTPKAAGATAETLRAMVGEFANELLSQAWRQKILEENRVILEAVTTQALAGAMGPPTIDDLASFDFSEEGFDDPLGIAMSWEEKHKKKPDEKADEKGSAP
jgi:His-Xaa-Ser system protein HxsD